MRGVSPNGRQSAFVPNASNTIGGAGLGDETEAKAQQDKGKFSHDAENFIAEMTSEVNGI